MKERRKRKKKGASRRLKRSSRQKSMDLAVVLEKHRISLLCNRYFTSRPRHADLNVRKSERREKRSSGKSAWPEEKLSMKRILRSRRKNLKKRLTTTLRCRRKKLYQMARSNRWKRSACSLGSRCVRL